MSTGAEKLWSSGRGAVTPAQHLTRSCEVKAHTRSLPVKRSPLANPIHRALIKETNFKFRVKAGRRVR